MSMASLLHFKLLVFFLLPTLFHAIGQASSRNMCSPKEMTALLRIKSSFLVDKYASFNPGSYPKVESWIPKTNCCQWDGITCNRVNGHVISLDLSSSWLSGLIEPDNALFSLNHLRKLNLADNTFNYSPIPYGFGHLIALTHLNLSNSRFSGEIPMDITMLVSLVSLDLSSSQLNLKFPLKLQKTSLRNFIQNLTELRQLHLDGVSISSPLHPDTFGNLSSLVSLRLQSCRLSGQFPENIFHLPFLEMLNVRGNGDLTGHMPGFHRGSYLRFLDLSSTGFSGELPTTIKNLGLLTHLYVNNCSLSGSLPYQTSKLSNLVLLDLRRNGLSGSIPPSLFVLPRLTCLDLSENHLTGRLDDTRVAYSPLEAISLNNNELNGEIPNFIFNLVNLTKLVLHSNKLSGTVHLGTFSMLQNLVDLRLSNNSLTMNHEHNFSSTFPKFKKLGLSSCNISDFPEFLRDQKAIEELDLSNNRIGGKLPKWLWSMWRETLTVFDISHNVLVGFEESTAIIPWEKAKLLDFHSNMFQGSVPVPATETFFFSMSDNNLTGEISPLICEANSLAFLDLSNNSLSGLIPKCLGHFGNSLTVLDLGMNNFVGEIPNSFTEGCSLRTLDLRQNKLQGKMPRSLVNCTKLEVLNLGNNLLDDVFPSWLEILPELQVLVLRSNKFHGAIGPPTSSSPFSKLRIICMYQNDLFGDLPSGYFQGFHAMMTDNDHKPQLEYMGGRYYTDSVTVINKGIEMVMVKILTTFKAADFSYNNFNGEIPEVLGKLRSIHVLNFSSNSLIGSIPSSFGNLQALESLDLSHNKLTGEIPVELTNLTFLEVLDLSQNHLQGPIPRGKQFETFENSSYTGNTELCGLPLSKRCRVGTVAQPPSSASEENDDSSSTSEFFWKGVTLGGGLGIIVGVVSGHILFRNKDRWFEDALDLGWPRRRKNIRRERTWRRKMSFFSHSWSYGK